MVRPAAEDVRIAPVLHKSINYDRLCLWRRQLHGSMTMLFGEWLSRYYSFIFIMVILLYTIIFNRKMYSKLKGGFLSLICIVVIAAICSGLEVSFAGLPYRTVWRKILSTVCYILRPAIMYCMLMIIVRNDKKSSRILYGIPLMLVSIILLVDLPYSYNLVFTFTEDNIFTVGPLHPVTYLVLVFYLALILVLIWKRSGSKTGSAEMVTVMIGVGFIILNICGERFIPGFTGGNSDNATALAILIYAIHFKNLEDLREKQLLETTEQKTGLLNENACMVLFNELLKRPDSVEYVAIFFDLERFGLINDRYGRAIGDRVIADYAAILNKMKREDEILARLGGDRFIAVVLERNLDVLLAQLASTRVKFNENGVDYDINVSAHVGVCKVEKDEHSAEDIISHAQAALNYGKNAGNAVTYMTPELKAMLKDEKQFASDIPVAMADEEFVAYYQPKVNSRTNNLCGAEALVRWQHNGELVPPGRFIPIMETKDLMCEMDFYMLRHVCADISAWIERGHVPPTISVNFSRRNLSNKDLAADIDAVVNEYHVPKKMIEIEITETNDEFPISVLKDFVDELHKRGYKVAVDDFGSGSSSLSLIREVNFDTFKIDKGFVDKADEKDLKILNSMIKLAKEIGVETLAEGVEQKEQVDTLLSMGCEIIQGYYFDRPLPKESFEKRIISRRYKVEQG